MSSSAATLAQRDAYVSQHEQGTLIEMNNEEELLKRFNEKRLRFQCWPLAPIPGLTTAFHKSWLALVKVPAVTDAMIFPAIGDHFSIDVKATVERHDGKYSLVSLKANRIVNPYEDVQGLADPLVARCAALKIDVPRSWENDAGITVEFDIMKEFRTVDALHEASSLSLTRETCQDITIMWDTSSVTFEAELAALRHFTEEKRLEEQRPGRKSQAAFDMIIDFKTPHKRLYNLHSEFPHLASPNNPRHKISPALVKKFRAFNDDHKAAYNALKEIPNGLFFLNGCPGAGKTEFNMVLSALIQAKSRPGPKKKRSPILFIVDINKTVDDAADRYYCLCKKANMNLRIIRMHGWPYEMRNSHRLNETKGDQANGATSANELDFTKKFLTTAGLMKHAIVKRNPNKAPNLDEAAWEYFERHRKDCFKPLERILETMDVGWVLDTGDWKALRSQISLLYRAVLAQTDFIATTPVAASGSFNRLFRPEVIFIDEAPHARELTSLIPIAFFNPFVWIFTGDVNQTRPFVKGGDKRDALKQGLQINPFAERMKLSTMARAELADAINGRLLVNNRAFGNLHRLPSKLFYQGQMTTAYAESACYPPSVKYMKHYLEQLGGVSHVDENRVVVHIVSSREKVHLRSFWNPAHNLWVLNQAQNLLSDHQFRSATDSENPGTIMIATPYSSAVRQYVAAVKTWAREWQDRVHILTVDKAQGNQADVVFLDMVRTAKVGFMDEPQRLNVAITRARQAEVIVMSPESTWRIQNRRRLRSRYTSLIWDDAMQNGRLFRL